MLPILEYKSSILYLLEKHRVLMLVGETGCGKSTQLPLIIHSAGVYNKLNSNNQPSVICITQPRGIAAVRLAERVSETLETEIGSLVGYTIRHKDVTSETKTEIKFLTEGILLREIYSSPCLDKYWPSTRLTIVNRNEPRLFGTFVELSIILGIKCEYF